jgi:hypothetical protein
MILGGIEPRPEEMPTEALDAPGTDEPEDRTPRG